MLHAYGIEMRNIPGLEQPWRRESRDHGNTTNTNPDLDPALIEVKINSKRIN